MRVQFSHPDPGAVHWQPGEIVTLRITEAAGDAYEAESMETFPPDLKEQHAAELQAQREVHEAAIRSQQEQIDSLLLSIRSADRPR